MDFEEAIREHQSMMASLTEVWPSLLAAGDAVIELQYRTSNGTTTMGIDAWSWDAKP